VRLWDPASGAGERNAARCKPGPNAIGPSRSGRTGKVLAAAGDDTAGRSCLGHGHRPELAHTWGRTRGTVSAVCLRARWLSSLVPGPTGDEADAETVGGRTAPGGGPGWRGTNDPSTRGGVSPRQAGCWSLAGDDHLVSGLGRRHVRAEMLPYAKPKRQVLAVCFSSTGELLASAGADALVKVWERPRGKSC